MHRTPAIGRDRQRRANTAKASEGLLSMAAKGENTGENNQQHQHGQRGAGEKNHTRRENEEERNIGDNTLEHQTIKIKQEVNI